MDMQLMIEQATDYIKAKTDYRPKVGVILGSGLGSYGDSLENARYCEYKDIPHFPRSTVEGHKGRFVITNSVICMQGRFHFYEGYTMEQVVFPIRVMKKLGIETLVITNAAGGVNPNFQGGDFMVIKDHINFMGANPLFGKNLDEFGARFPDMSSAYNEKLCEIAFSVGRKQGLSLQQGVYMAFTGPSYETPAEVRMAAVLGADAVGMSTVPEVITAVHSGIDVLGISCISNMAAGVSKQPLNHMEVIEITEKVKPQFTALLKGILEELTK